MLTNNHIDEDCGKFGEGGEVLQPDTDLLDDEAIVHPKNRPVLLGKKLLDLRALSPMATDVPTTDQRSDTFINATKSESLVHKMLGARAARDNGAPGVLEKANAPVLFVSVCNVVRKVASRAPTDESIGGEVRPADKEVAGTRPQRVV